MKYGGKVCTILNNVLQKVTILLLTTYTIFRAQNARRHAALCCAAAVICREALKMCGRCAARLAAMP